MTLYGSKKLLLKKRDAALAAAFPNGVRCQKCLELGHWSYECKGKRKYAHRSSRTKQLNKNINDITQKALEKSGSGPTAKRKKSDKSSSSDSDSDSDSFSSSSSSLSSSGSNKSKISSSDSDSDSSSSSSSSESSVTSSSDNET